jgi:hypothetical protein
MNGHTQPAGRTSQQFHQYSAQAKRDASKHEKQLEIRFCDQKGAYKMRFNLRSD